MNETLLRNKNNINTFYHKFKRKIQKIAINFYRKLNITSVEDKVSYEREALSLARHMIKHYDTELFMTPITNKRFVINDRLRINIIIKNKSIYIYENSYAYPTILSDKGYEHIINFYDQEIERRREKMELEIEEDIKISLKTILKRVIEDEEVKYI